jgi:hypothetical protein
MESNFHYYYNDVPGHGLCRNNLIYTSLINTDATEFCMWFHNDSEYHKGYNEVVDPALIEMKYKREKNFLVWMTAEHKHMVPEITRLDLDERKIFFAIQGVDFWEQSHGKTYEDVLHDWQEQMLHILETHKKLGIYKYSLHPSSYFVIDGGLRNVNYFFAYRDSEPKINVGEHLSHISENRRNELFPKMKQLGINSGTAYPFDKLQILCLESFRDVYPDAFIDAAIKIYK